MGLWGYFFFPLIKESFVLRGREVGLQYFLEKKSWGLRDNLAKFWTLG